MTDFRISNLTIHLGDQRLPLGTIYGYGKVALGSDDSSGGPGCGCSCSCSCSCTCTCTCTSTSQLSTDDLQTTELVALRESLNEALSAVEAAQENIRGG